MLHTTLEKTLDQYEMEANIKPYAVILMNGAMNI